MVDNKRRPKKAFVRLDAYEPADAEFLWKPYIPLGFVTIIEGDPGLGKSWLTIMIAAAVSRGKCLPGQKSKRKGKVLIMSAEDDPRITLRPRLDACNGNPEMVFYAEDHFTFDKKGMETLRRSIHRHRPLLLIIDPIVAYIGGNVDLHRANETRPLFRELAEIASSYKCAIVIVRHLTKSGNENATYRGIGSIDIIAAVRSALLVDKDLDDPRNLRAVLHHKANLSHQGRTLLYQIERVKKRPGSRFRWKGFAAYDISEFMQRRQKRRGASDDKRKTAVELLKQLMAKGPLPATELATIAEAAGVKSRTLARAKKELGVKSERKGDAWMCRLP